MDKNAIREMYAEKERYVEETLAAMLAPMNKFGNIFYAKNSVTDEEYVKLVEADGYPRYINVTGNSLDAIGKEVCRFICGQMPYGIIKSREKQIEINKMFAG